MLKNVLGFCTAKGCMKKGIYEITISGSGKIIKRKICKTHAKELIKMGVITGATFKEEIHIG